MLKTSTSGGGIDTSTKCGVVYYSLPSIFQILCNECEEKILFNDFLEHFRKQHLFNNETIIGVGPLKSTILAEESAEVKLENLSDVDDDDDDEEEIGIRNKDFIDDEEYPMEEDDEEDDEDDFNQKNSSDTNDDSDISSSFFEFDYNDTMDEPELLLYEEDQEYIDSIEHIGFGGAEETLSAIEESYCIEENANANGNGNGNTGTAGVTVGGGNGGGDGIVDVDNHQDNDDLPKYENNNLEYNMDVEDSWSESLMNEESNQCYSDEGGFEYVLFEEEIQPNSVVEEFEPENDAKDDEKKFKNKNKLRRTRKRRTTTIRKPIKEELLNNLPEKNDNENSGNNDNDNNIKESSDDTKSIKVPTTDINETVEVKESIADEIEEKIDVNEIETETETDIINDINNQIVATIKSKKKRYECHICHHILESKFNLKYHIDHVHGNKGRKYQCKHCSKCLPTSFELIVHKRKAHPELYAKPVAPPVEVDDLDKRPVPCPLCFRRFRNGSSLSTHMRIHNVTRTDDKTMMDRTMTCNICGKIARSPKFYYIHMLRMHGTTFCDICNMNFNTPAEAFQHKSNHKTEKKFKCEFCDTSCFTARGLERHMQTHKELTYAERNESFEKSGNLPEKSLESNQYVCEICGQTLRNITILKAHMMRHRNERPFCCDVCGKSFYNKGTLKSHKTIHSNERPYFCTVCGATFQYKRALKTHMILHSDKRDFKCSYCDKAYVEAARLRYHIRLKHGCSLNDNLPELKKLAANGGGNGSRNGNGNGDGENSSKTKAKTKIIDRELELATKSLEEIVRQSE